MVLNEAITIWRPSNITMNLSSPTVSSHCHWICFATANKGWSTVTTVIWSGLKYDAVSLTFCIACFMVATKWACSGRSGNKADISGWKSKPRIFDAWYVDHVICIPPSTVSVILTWLSHWNSMLNHQCRVSGFNGSKFWHFGGSGELAVK